MGYPLHCLEQLLSDYCVQPDIVGAHRSQEHYFVRYHRVFDSIGDGNGDVFENETPRVLLSVPGFCDMLQSASSRGRHDLHHAKWEIFKCAPVSGKALLQARPWVEEVLGTDDLIVFTVLVRSGGRLD